MTVLDGHTLNPGDLTWDAMAALGQLTVHERTAPESVTERAADSEIVFTNKALLPAEAIKALPKLRYIGVLATGYNVVDVVAAEEQGVTVTNIPDYGSISVAQHTWALILELANRVGQHADAVAKGDWIKSPDFCFWNTPLTELAGLSLGIVGFGRIGQAVAKLGEAFGMKVLVHSRTRPQSLPESYEWCSVEELFGKADVVSLHCPLTDTNNRFVNQELLKQMKSTAFLINTGRGPLIHEGDLAAALNAGQIGGAAVDVLSVEPPEESNPLFGASNLIITPHIAWATRAARQRLMDIAVRNLELFLKGTPTNVVEP